MFFLTFSNTDIRFAEQELVWKTYSAAKALPTTRKVEIIGKKQYAAAVINKKDKTFKIHMAALSVVDSSIYLFQQA